MLFLLRSIVFVASLAAFVLPSWGETQGVGVVTALTGKADLKRPQAPQVVALKRRDNLFVRDVVDTHEKALTRILLMGKSSVVVRELSRFEIREEVLPGGAQRALINLAVGKIRVVVARRLMKPGDLVEIRTPNAIAGVRGSEGVIEVSRLPDGRPLTVITGISGEFELTLPGTAPFIAQGLEFRDGPALTSDPDRRGRPMVAMADTLSDTGPALRLAQALPVSVTQGVQARATGFPGAQALEVVLKSQAQLQQALRDFKMAPPISNPPERTIDKIVDKGEKAGLDAARSAAAAVLGAPANGVVAVVNGGGVGGETATVITPLTASPPSVPAPIDTRIGVLVYDCASCADRVNGLTGSGSLFKATNVSSAEFQTMTTSQIAAFRVLAIPSTDGLDNDVNGLLQNNSVQRVGNAVSGNQVITGLHTQHDTGQRDQFVINALQFAAQGGTGTTGLLVATDGCSAAGCVGGKAGQAWIDQTGSFLKNTFAGTTINRGLDQNSVAISDASHAVNSGNGLTGGNTLNTTGGNWDHNFHSTFSGVPTGYKKIQESGGDPVTLVK